MTEEDKERFAEALTRGRFSTASKTWAGVEPSGPATERWRNYHRYFGTPHPTAWDDPELLYEYLSEDLKDLLDDKDCNVAWSCDDVYHTGIVVFVVCPWCSRCRLRAGLDKIKDQDPQKEDA